MVILQSCCSSVSSKDQRKKAQSLKGGQRFRDGSTLSQSVSVSHEASTFNMVIRSHLFCTERAPSSYSCSLAEKAVTSSTKQVCYFPCKMHAEKGLLVLL